MHFRTLILVPAITLVVVTAAIAQVEHVPVANQVYEFLDRLGVKGVLPLYSGASLPLSRAEVAEYLRTAEAKRDQLTDTERGFLDKFRREFALELNLREEEPFVLLGEHRSIGDIITEGTSDKEKYLYRHADSSVSLFAEFLGDIEWRGISGDSYGRTHATLGNIGGRFRGTVQNIIGYYLQSTNGQLWGDRQFALSDPRLAANFKFNELDAPNFDFTEAYLRLQWDMVGVEFGREYTLIGLGYSDRLILSDNAPAFDFFRIDFRYRSFRFTFLHGAILGDEQPFRDVPNLAPEGANKYLALHRFQFSLFDRVNIGISEMVIYQRLTPEYAYLNPVNFFKSAEHQLRDRDNAFLVFDAELFPADGYKLYGSWLIDDIFFSRIGTGWWGNEFAWQGGLFAADVAGMNDVDAVLEYTRIEPYVYSNRLAGNNYTHSNVALAHRLNPNSDEWFLELRYRLSPKLRLRMNYRQERHGANIIEGDSVIFNAGGSVFQGHRDSDADTAPFLAGTVMKTRRLQVKAEYELITNVFLAGTVELRNSRDRSAGGSRQDILASGRFRFEY